MIDINTDDLQQYVNIAKQANEAISNAANLLNSIVIHNDWECPERDGINNNTQRNRSESLRLQADCDSFYNAIIYATETFLQAEQETNTKINGVDSKIAAFLSIIPQANSKSNFTDGIAVGNFSGLINKKFNIKEDNNIITKFGSFVSELKNSGGGGHKF